MFHLTPLAREHLVKTSPWFLGPYYESLKNRPVALDLVKVLRTGKPANWGSQKDGKDWHLAMETEEFAVAVHRRHGLSRRLPLAGRRESDRPVATTTSARYRRRFGRLRLFARDASSAPVGDGLRKAPVDRIAARAIASRGCTAKVAVTAGDMLEGALPRDADVHLYSNVLHDWDEPVVRQLIAKSFDALPPGGLIVIHDAFLNAAKDGPLHVAEYSVLLMHSSEGRCYSTREMEQYLMDAGFREASLPRHRGRARRHDRNKMKEQTFRPLNRRDALARLAALAATAALPRSAWSFRRSLIRWKARSRTTSLVFAAAGGAPPRSPPARSSAAAPTAWHGAPSTPCRRRRSPTRRPLMPAGAVARCAGRSTACPCSPRRSTT